MNATDYTLKIDGHLPEARLRCGLVGYERAYDGPAAVKFRCDTDWANPPYGGDRIVELWLPGATEDDAPVRLFEGLLNGPAPFVTADNHRYVEYEAVDRCSLAAKLYPKNQYGNYSFNLRSRRLGAVLEEWLAYTEVKQALDDAGIDRAVVFTGGAEEIENFPVSLSNATLDSAMREIARSAPGVGVLLDCAIEATSSKPRYRFVNLYGAALYDLAIDVTPIGKLQIKESIEGRGGAVQTLTGHTLGTTEMVLERRANLKPAWDQVTKVEGKTLEQRWNSREAAKVDEATKKISELGQVFRLYSFEDADPPPSPKSPVVVEKLVYVDPEGSTTDPNSKKWKAVECLAIDYEKKTVLLKEPMIRTVSDRGEQIQNMIETSRCAGKAATMRIGWTANESGKASITIPSIRVPATGFSGRVSQLYPLRGRTTVNVAVPAGVDRARWVAFAHAQLSEPDYKGEIPIVGPPPVELLALALRINLTTATHGRTGYEHLQAPLKGISVEFSEHNALGATLQLSRDTTELLKEQG